MSRAEMSTGAPAHVPLNLFEKLKSRIWAYSSLARWTPQALDRALANVSGAQDRSAYLGYSTDVSSSISRTTPRRR